MYTLRCQKCSGQFRRPNSRGPIPKFCSGACRQAAHRERSAKATDGVLWRTPGRGWTFRHSLDGRTYPEGSEYMPVRVVGVRRPIPRRPH